MQILLAWKAKGLAELEAEQHWTTALTKWKDRYQTLIEQPLHLATAQNGSLFLGLIYLPELFREWQEFYEDESYAVAWAGISHNLLDILPQHTIDQMNKSFVLQLHQDAHDSFLRTLEGRFVVAVLSRVTGTLRVITNNYGLTPCFWTTGKYGTAIGTRIVTLMELVGRSCAPNRAAMIQVFAMDWCLGSDTVFEGVYQIEPGMELLLKEDDATVKERCYMPPPIILEQVQSVSHQNYLAIGSDGVNAAITCQMRHSKMPLINLTGGKDSRVIAASAVGLGYHPDCDISGELPSSKEIEIAFKIAEVMNLPLHPIYPEEHYADNFTETLRLWSLWTEGMIPAHILSFGQTIFALSPKPREFYSQYRQIFSGLGGEVISCIYYGTEMLVKTFSTDEIIARLFQRPNKRFYENFLSHEENRQLMNKIRQIVIEAEQFGLTGRHLIDYFYWRERTCRWGGYMLDMQQLGRHLFAPMCQNLLTAVSLSMTVAERVSAAWHHYQIQRMFPAASAIPFVTPAPLSGFRKAVFDIHPLLFKFAWHAKNRIFVRQRQMVPIQDREELGKFFHDHLQRFLFSGDQWWPTIIQYEKGQKMWENFVRGKEAKPLWNLATFELWARNFLT